MHVTIISVRKAINPPNFNYFIKLRTYNKQRTSINLIITYKLNDTMEKLGINFHFRLYIKVERRSKVKGALGMYLYVFYSIYAEIKRKKKEGKCLCLSICVIFFVASYITLFLRKQC